MTYQFDWSSWAQVFPELLVGAYYTIVITVVGLLIGFVFGIVAGLGRLSRNKWLYWPATVYVEVIRGTPILVQILYLYFVLPIILGHFILRAGHAIPIAPLVAGFMAISINSGAYVAEVVRGAIQSIDKGQIEAGRSIGLSHAQTLRCIVWPQAFRRMIPPLGNQFIVSLKDTSLFSVISATELTFKGKEYIAATFTTLETYTLVALLYLCMTLGISFGLRRMEKRLGERSR